MKSCCPVSGPDWPRRGRLCFLAPSAFQAFRSDDPRDLRVRVAVSFLNREGKRIAGGLPLYYATQRYNGAATIAWRPDGDAEPQPLHPHAQSGRALAFGRILN